MGENREDLKEELPKFQVEDQYTNLLVSLKLLLHESQKTESQSAQGYQSEGLPRWLSAGCKTIQNLTYQNSIF